MSKPVIGGSGGSATGRRVLVLAPLALGGIVLALLALGAVGVAQGASGSDAPRAMMDFDVFRLVGDLVRNGRLVDAYSQSTLEGLEAGLSRSGKGYLAYAYPPPFGLAMGALSVLPIGAAYAVFMAGGFALFALALGCLSAAWFWPTILMLSPALLVNVMAGQNGMMTAGLAGLAVALSSARRSGPAGILAGLLAALKPQIATALPLVFLLRRDGRSVAAMVAMAAAVLGGTMAVLGFATGPAFLAGLSETGRLMGQGHFPFHRMISVYACLLTFGMPPSIALACHLAAALAMLGAVAVVGRRLGTVDAASGLALAATAFVSPYFYDYDLPVVGLGLALVLPALALGRPALLGLMGTVAAAGAAGSIQSLALTTRLSLGAPMLFTVFAVILTMLRRRTSGGADPVAAAHDDMAFQ